MNIIRSGAHSIVAICDEELLGRTLREGGIVFEVSERFYGGQLVDVDTALQIAAQYSVVNMVGERVVSRAIELGLVHQAAVMRIEGVPHAMVLRTWI
ncbi:DUF424 domain-containing protein [Candidatus Bathyarchaeota archaeon]|nr:MAG: DUF424 domain-containing protein [Candidatus Bathyarchaeota archaeon]